LQRECDSYARDCWLVEQGMALQTIGANRRFPDKWGRATALVEEARSANNLGNLADAREFASAADKGSDDVHRSDQRLKEFLTNSEFGLDQLHRRALTVCVDLAPEGQRLRMEAEKTWQATKDTVQSGDLSKFDAGYARTQALFNEAKKYVRPRC